MVRLYGTSKSRSTRCLWALNELGVPYEHVPVSTAQAKEREHYFRNPNGHIPVLEDNGGFYWESMAINLFLGDKYGKAPLWPATADDRVFVYQWTLWAVTEVEPHILSLRQHTVALPPEQRKAEVAKQAEASLKKSLAILDNHFADQGWVLGMSFSMADLNPASVIFPLPMMKFDLTELPRVEAWLKRCTARPAFKSAMAMP